MQYPKQPKLLEMNHSRIVKPATFVALVVLFILIISPGTIAQTTQTFTASNTFTAAAGVATLTVECWGGGGGGGNSSHTGTGISRAGGGAGGAYVKKTISSPSGSYTVTIGSGGNGGNAGTDSWFGSLSTVIAKGGAAGGNANKSLGTGGTGSSSGSIGDAGSVFGGGNGAAASVLGTGAGGGGAGSTGTGNNATFTIVNGAGTANYGGAGGIGFLLALASANGNDAADYGGGGSGASCVTIIAGSSATGGKGGAGLATVSYNCPTYSLTNADNTSICAGNAATVAITSSTAGLPTGTYTVTYNLSSPNAATGNTATMVVTTAGTGTFTTSNLLASGPTTITITHFKSGSGIGCSSNISSGNTATIAVNTAPSIISQPSAPSTTCSGSGTQTIGVAATGSGLIYSWRKNGTAITNGGVYSGQGTATLTLTSATAAEAGSYDVVVSGTCTPSVTSNSVAVTINPNTSILTDALPLTQLRLLNAIPANLSIAAGGTAINYQWYSNTSNSNYGGSDLGAANGGQTNTYTPPTASSSTLYYYCVVSGMCGTEASSTVEVISTNTDTWLGGGTNNWSTNSNWNTGTAPSWTNDVVIPTGTTPYPVLSVSSAINHLNLPSGTSLGIGSNTLTINGSVTGTGNFIGSNSSGLTINGSAGTIYFKDTGTGNYLKYLTVANGASATLGNDLNITAGVSANNEGALTVAGSGILTTGGFLTIKSNQYGTARISEGSSSGNYISGDATIERYIPQNSNKAWRMLATNTSGQTIKEAWQENQPALLNGNPGYGIMISKRFATLAEAQLSGFDTLSNSPSIYSFDPVSNNWVALFNTNSKPFASEEGYFVFIRGDRSPGQFTPYTAPVAPTTLRSKGTIYQGDQPVKNVTASKYLLLRNPYASALDLRNISIGGGTADAYQVWDPKLAGTAGNGAYQTLTRVGSDYVVTPGGGSYPSSGSVFNTVESGASFIVQATGSDGTVQVLESSKSSGSNLVFRPATEQPDEKRIIANLYADNITHPLVDGNMILFGHANSNAVDKHDVRKLTNIGETFGVMKQGTELVVERRAMPYGTDTIFLNMRNLKRMNYTIEFSVSNMDIPGIYGYIEDKYSGTGASLNLSGNTLFNFSVDTNPASFSPGRFMLVFKPVSVLPLVFIDLKATATSNNVAVQWKVENENNINTYHIERSMNGNDFVDIGFVDTNSELNYNFIDAVIKPGVYYYRIKSICNSGLLHYSKAVKISVNKKGEALLVWPNPVQNKFFNIHLGQQKAGIYEIVISNSIGQQVYTKTIKHAGSIFNLQVNIQNVLQPGIYNVQAVLPGNTTKTQKFVIAPAK